MPGLIMVLALLLMLPGISRADFQVEAIGKSGRVTSLLVEPTATLLNHAPAAIMFPGSSDATRPGTSGELSLNGDGLLPARRVRLDFAGG